MIFNPFKKTESDEKFDRDESLIRVAALLVHAAKIDENYSQKEVKIIKNFLKSLNEDVDVENIIKKAEIDERDSSQILKYTQEIKKNTLKFRTKIIKVLWKIILSDDNSDMYEGNLMRRICGLLYISDRISGEIKSEILKEK
tara:strand:+ start:197 stop:622 length:426 start_codon:yes stop_codon:yes gene_type:complete